jgi:hypothetical protein
VSPRVTTTRARRLERVRIDRPHIRVIPEWFGGGTLPRKELHEAADELTANQAGLIAVGEPTIEKGLDKAFTGAARVVKRAVDATTDELTSELQQALKESNMSSAEHAVITLVASICT